MGDGVARRGERRDLQLRAVESHCGMGFSMQVCQQAGSWSMTVEAAAETTESKIDAMIVWS